MATMLVSFLYFYHFVYKKSYRLLFIVSVIFATVTTLLFANLNWIVGSNMCNLPVDLKFTNRFRLIFNHDNKQVYFENWNNISVVVKEYNKNYNCQGIDDLRCQQLYVDSRFYSENVIKNLILCPDEGNFKEFLKDNEDLINNIEFDSVTEVILLKMLLPSDGWPVPLYLGNCGNIVFEEYAGTTMTYVDFSLWLTKLKAASELLIIAHKFTFKHQIFAFYFTDITPDNIAFKENMEAVLIDLDNVIIVDKRIKDILSPHHVSEIFPDDDSFIFSTKDICESSISDHNFYAVCEHLFRRSSLLGNGLLEDIPSYIDAEGDLTHLVKECANPQAISNRFMAADLLQEKLKSTIFKLNGVVVIDDEYMRERKIFGQVVCSFRYGREEDEVMGLNFQKDLFLASEQVFPQSEKNNGLTKLQERLLKKLGGNAFPFSFNLPTSAPASVTLQPGSEDQGEPCGVQYFVKMFAGESETDRTHRRSTVALGIRKIQYAPSKQGRQPCTIVRKDFMLSPGELELEVTLDKQLYHHNEKISVNICIRNNSNKVVKKIKAMVQQGVDVVLFQNGQYRTSVASIETQEGCPIQPGSCLQKVIYLVPVLESNKDRRGIALDGQLKRQDTNLASSTLLASPDSRDAFGIIVSYSVKVKLYLGALGGEVGAELPLVLMHPKPTNKNITFKPDSQADTETFKNETMDQDGCDAE